MSPDAPATQGTGRAIGFIALAWTTLAIVAAAQSVILSAGQPVPLSPIRAIAWQLPQWWAWALLTPPVIAVDAGARRAGARLGTLVLLHTVVGALAIGAHSAVVALADMTFFPNGLLQAGFPATLVAHLRGRMQFEILSYLGLVGGWYAWDYARRHHRQTLASAALEVELSRSELRALKAQLQPHFLFNTLQAIGALTERDPTAARLALERLGGLLRYVLRTSGRQLVPLGEEVGFIRDYLEMEQLRFHDRLHVTFAIDDATTGLLVPHFVLLPLVENALQHGLAPVPGAVGVEISAVVDGPVLTLRVCDDGVGYRPGPPGGTGVGLTVTRSRLHHIYGEDAALRVEAAPGGGCVATVALPVETVPAPDPPVAPRTAERA